jgi:hypothetical protein
MKAFGICVLCALSAAGCATKSIQPDSDLAARNLESSLGGRGVEIDLVRGEAQQSWGSGFSLGGGYILTAAHVVDSAGGETGIFVRFYDFLGELVNFNILILNRVNDGQFSHQLVTTRLRPILSEEITALAEAAGFRPILLYGDMSGARFTPHSASNLVMEAHRP